MTDASGIPSWVFPAVATGVVVVLWALVQRVLGRIDRDVQACNEAGREQARGLQAIEVRFAAIQAEVKDRANIGALIKESEQRLDAKIDATAAGLRSELDRLVALIQSRENSGRWQRPPAEER